MKRWRCALVVGAFAVVSTHAGAAGPARPAPAAKPAAENEPMYNGTDKRDPFRPPRVAANAQTGEARTPLERFEIGQLRLVATIYEGAVPRAVVEDEQGLGYIVKVGTRLGPNGGEIANIQRGRVVVRESFTDFYGNDQPSETVMEMKTEERTTEGGRKR